jgi:hypothetical protein
MSQLTATTTPTSTRSRARTVGRWMVTFAGFPLGGLTAELVVGPVDGPAAAVLGGLITGTILGAVQAWGLGPRRPDPVRWAAATGLGLAVGLGVGAAVVDYGTGLSDLVVQGAVSGAAVGIAQAVVLRPRLGRIAAAWPLALAAVWAAGWAITTSIGVQVEDGFTVFGSSGAITVTALTSVLPLLLERSEA